MFLRMKKMGLFPVHSRWRMVMIFIYIIFMVYAMLIEPNWIAERTFSLETTGGDGPVIRIAQVSDLHIRNFGWREQRLVARLQELQPDLVVLTGDMVLTAASLPELAHFLSELAMPGKILAVLGNWEHDIPVSISKQQHFLASHGVRLLVNESLLLPFGNTSLLVTGLDDLLTGTPDLLTALHSVAPAKNHLFLFHMPLFFDQLQVFLSAQPGKEKRFYGDLSLAGHTHGGQVTLFGKVLAVPPGSGRYEKGWYGSEGHRLYVSSGLGAFMPFRFFARPELPVFEWRLQR